MRLLSFLALLALATPTHAQEMPPPGALSCSGCHGAGSNMTLDALNAEEIETAMLAFKNGSREATLMNRLAAGLEAEEIALIAAWIAEAGDME